MIGRRWRWILLLARLYVNGEIRFHLGGGVVDHGCLQGVEILLAGLHQRLMEDLEKNERIEIR